MAIHVRDESKLLARHSVIYGIGTSANKIVGFLLLPVYTQYLSTREYGIKELVGLSTDIIGVLLATAISSAFYRFYFDYTAESDRMLALEVGQEHLPFPIPLVRKGQGCLLYTSPSPRDS